MKLNAKLFLIFWCILKVSSAQFIDDFSDSNFVFNPVWRGDTNNYEINAFYQLHLNAVNKVDTSYLSTPSLAINNAVWEFRVQLSFNPSSSNYAKVYLVSDQENLKGALNGYFVRLGNTDDEVSLYRQDGLVETEIIDGINDRLDTKKIDCTVKVTRDSLGTWQVFSDTTGGSNYVLEGSVFDARYVHSLYFGVSSRYTSTRSTLFFYDEFKVYGTRNEEEPILTPPLKAGDLIINEVLFNPYPGGADFVEIYNNSNKTINLQDWNLANIERDSIDNYRSLSDTLHFIYPGEFKVLSKDVNNITNEYVNAVISSFLEMKSLPTYNNDEGAVYLINDSMFVMDYFNYDEDIHFPLLNDVEGVSLERIDYNRLTNDLTNWHSAAEAVGFATPGYENSQYQKIKVNNEEVLIEPLSFSPDNNGIDDVVNITYQFTDPGFVANIIIYDANGRLVRNLITNQLLGVKGTFSWNGINNNNEKARIGIYIIYVEAFDVKGTVKSFKRTVVLAGQL